MIKERLLIFFFLLGSSQLIFFILGNILEFVHGYIFYFIWYVIILYSSYSIIKIDGRYFNIT